VKLSAFNVYVDKFPEADSTLVYNTFTGGFVSLDVATLAVLRKADAGGELEADERELIDPEFFDESVGILVESRKTEEQAYRDHLNAWRGSTDRLDCIVSTTLACNLDCTYCCQADVLDGRTMSQETGTQTAAWLASRALEIGAKHIDLAFIGGEPLLHPHRIRQVVEEVRSRTAEAGIKVTFNLITNGVFMTRKLVEEWVPLGLTMAKVTIDGDETTHSLTRRSKKRGEDSYATVFKNVVEASELIHVYLNGNYTVDTVHGFIPLIEKLAAAGFKKGSRVHFSPALQALGAPPEAGLGGCNFTGAYPEYLLPLADAVRRAGYTPTDDTYIGPCAFHRRHSYSVDPAGLVYNCPGFLGKSEWAVGSVESGLTARYERIANVNPQRSCGGCAHRPECAGGCVAAEWIDAGRMEGVNCEIGFYERHGGDFIKRKFLLATSDSVEEALSQLPDAPAAVMQRVAADIVKRRGEQVLLRVLAA
jgi:uncharacterized protein